jgi:hypothetical protein
LYICECVGGQSLSAVACELGLVVSAVMTGVKDDVHIEGMKGMAI